MTEFKTNHICKNPKCRKKYYACDFCDKIHSWRSVACSTECYQEYVNLVIAERSKDKIVDNKPERIDMTNQEIDNLMNTPIEEVFEKTKEELKDFTDNDGNINISESVEEINRNLKKKTSTRSKKKNSNDE